MGTLVGNGDGSLEAARGFVCGIVFGATSPLIGHPLDSLKTAMQANNNYAQGSAWQSLTSIVRREGFLALYRGLLPPLVGSSVFRSVQFSAYGAAMGSMREVPALTADIPGTGGMQWRVPLAGMFASTCRAVIETPLEALKVRRQVGKPFLSGSGSVGREFLGLYTGWGFSFARTQGLMTSFFLMADSLERHAPQLVATPIVGPFVKGSLCATLAWVLVWPLELAKNLRQASTPLPGLKPDSGWLSLLKYVIEHRGGVRGLYRGMGPGLARSLIANGSSMVAFSFCVDCFNRFGGSTGEV